MKKHEGYYASSSLSWSYSEAERAAIRAALGKLTVEEARSDIFMLESVAQTSYESNRDFARRLQREKDDVAKEIIVVEQLIKIPEIRIEGGDAVSETGPAMIASLPLLREISSHIAQEVESREDWIKKILTIAHKGNNSRLHAQQFFEFVDRIWIRSGHNREVKYNEEYIRFFEAAVKPPFTSKEIMLQHGVGWTKGMCKNHVYSKVNKK